MASVVEALALAWKHHQAGDLARAESIYLQVLAAAPSEAAAWCYYGMVCYDLGRFAEAEFSYRHALRLRPVFPEAQNNLGNALLELDRLDEAIASLSQALGQRGNYASAHQNLGAVLLRQGKVSEALTQFRRAIELKPDFAEAHKSAGIAALLLGDCERGWPEYEWRLACGGSILPPIDVPRWDGSSLAGRTILLRAEQGLGDTIQFARYIPLLEAQGAKVWLQCPPALHGILKSVADAASVGRSDAGSVGNVFGCLGPRDPLPTCDIEAPLLSLPTILRHSLADIPASVPYLRPEPGLVENWRNELGKHPGLKVGIAWQGSTQFRGDRLRSVPLWHFARLAAVPNVQLVSLQKGPGVEQLTDIAGCFSVVDFGERLDASGPFMDTAAIIASLDLVVASDSAVMHLAGALGAKVWLATPFVPDWRWLLDREDSPWYPTARLFRQRAEGDWQGVFTQMAQELRR